MQKIVPHLWFNTEAKEAAAFYTSLFPQSAVTHTSVIHNTPSGDCDIVSFTLWGYEFQAISAGPIFTPNPSISFMVNFDPSQDPEAATRIDTVWEKLKEGGKILMEIGAYPFSKRYGWVQDKYGFSWQLILTDPEGDERPLIIPALLFTDEKCGKAEEAMTFYQSVFQSTEQSNIARYPAGMEPDKEGTVMFMDAKLEGQWFAAMDSGREHGFTFNEAVSLMIHCETQEEIDRYWQALSAVPESEQCGWVKDKFGVSWQIVPTQMNNIMQSNDQEAIDRVTQAMLTMKKLDIAKLEAAAKGAR